MPAARLFASDIDGTLLVEDRPDVEATAAFTRWHVQNPDVALAYVTGRSRESALEVIDRFGLPRPDALVTSVGTAIHWWRAGSWHGDAEWSARLARSLGGHDLASADPIVLAVDGAALQDAADQSRFKRSYRRPDAAFDAPPIVAALSATGLQVNVVPSIDPRTGDGLLDLLPRDTDKGHAVEHLRARLGLATEHVAFAGDSGNDLAALLRPWWSIVVANAPDAVRSRFASGVDRRRRSVVADGEDLHGVLDGLECVDWT